MPDFTRCFACGAVTVQRGTKPPIRCPRCQSPHWFDPTYPHKGKHVQGRLFTDPSQLTRSTAQRPAEHDDEHAAKQSPTQINALVDRIQALPEDLLPPSDNGADPGPLPESEDQ